MDRTPGLVGKFQRPCVLWGQCAIPYRVLLAFADQAPNTVVDLNRASACSVYRAVALHSFKGA